MISGTDSGINFSSVSGIRDDAGSVGSSVIVHLSPTTSPLPSSSNVTGRGGTKSDYRRSTMEYVDKNANNISNTDYGKPLREDRLVHLIDKLQIDNDKQVERQATAHNHIAAAAVAPALLLANHISAPVLPEKSQNGNVKAEVCILSPNPFRAFPTSVLRIELERRNLGIGQLHGVGRGYRWSTQHR